MVVAGEPWMIPALSRIWEICFGDSPEYIRFFMERRFPTSQSFVWLEQGEPVGVVYLLPSLLQGKQSFYSYAGGVLPEYRNRGIFREIFHFLIEFCKFEGATLTVVPAPGLTNYYREMGYQPVFSYRKLAFKPKNAGRSIELREAEAEQYVCLRDRAFQELNYVQWNLEAVKYALEENRYCGGFAKIITIDQDYLLFGKKEDKVLNILETTLSRKLAEEIVPDLCYHWRVEQVIFRFPAEQSEERVENGGTWGTVPFCNGWMGLELL